MFIFLEIIILDELICKSCLTEANPKKQKQENFSLQRYFNYITFKGHIALCTQQINEKKNVTIFTQVKR